MRFAAIAIAAVSVAAGPAIADFHTFDGCDLGPDDIEPIVLPILDGEWLVYNGAGVALIVGQGGEMMFPMPPTGPDPVKLTYRDGLLFGTGGEPPQTYEILPMPREDAGDFGLPDALVPTMRDTMDFDLIGDAAPNCDPSLLPFLTFSAEMTMQGATVSYIGYLHVISAELMSGVTVMNGTAPDGSQVAARRLMTVRR